jgi:stage II sporulation protein R
MDRRLKRWELALMFGVLFALILGAWLDQEQTDLADQVIRLHVVANSDSDWDQAMKLAVRDRVLAKAETLYTADATRAQALEILSAHLPELAREGRTVVEEWGSDQSVTASLETCWFPTKEYEDFALPAGEYTALRIVIGEGEGQNWWCVAFPPLCLGAASESVEQAAQAGNFTQGQAALITGESEGYVLKFKAMELLGELKGHFCDP